METEFQELRKLKPSKLRKEMNAVTLNWLAKRQPLEMFLYDILTLLMNSWRRQMNKNFRIASPFIPFIKTKRNELDKEESHSTDGQMVNELFKSVAGISVMGGGQKFFF